MIKEQWKIFCRTLYTNLILMERGAEREMEESFRRDKPYSDRQRLLKKVKWCEEYKKKVVESVNNRQFCLKDGDVEVIESKGYDYYFSYMDCSL